MPGQLHIRKAISPGTGDCCTTVRAMLLEALKAKRHVDLAGVHWLRLSSGCRSSPSLHFVQPRRLHPLLIQLSARVQACDAVSSISILNQAFYRTASELLF